MLETGCALYFGDNLDMLRAKIRDESVDLVYLDPPFNSNQDYNVLFKEQDGTPALAQKDAFLDSWRWDDVAARSYAELVEGGGQISLTMQAFHRLLGNSDMLAYLAMMAPRLIELQRVLKPTGSLYLHCDATASHYLKLLLDAVFGPENYRNEIIWKRSDTHNDATKQFPVVSDSIFLYAASSSYTFNRQYTSYPAKTLRNWYRWLEFPDGSARRMTKKEIETQTIPRGARRFNADNTSAPAGGGMAKINKKTGKPNGWYIYKGYEPPERGWRYSPERMQELDAKGLLLFPQSKSGRIMRKRYLDEQNGPLVGNVWTDISQIRANDAERLGYPTQKPEALLERIILASSNEGDTVLDPFCGCGTTVAAAQKLGRRWIGIDVSHLAINLITRRLRESFTDISWEVEGEPGTLSAARHLAVQDPHQFQWWILTRVGAGDQSRRKKGPDKGIDGRQFYYERPGGDVKQIIYSVKSGIVHRRDVHELRGVVERENAQIGVLLTLQPPTKAMREEAASAGFYDSLWGRHPRVQILTVEEILDGRGIDAPPQAQLHVKHRRRPQKTAKSNEQQMHLPLLYTIPPDPTAKQSALADVDQRPMKETPPARRIGTGG